MSVYLDDLLDLPNVRVENYTKIEGSVTLRLVMLSDSITCPHCGKSTDELHQNRPVLIRDLSVFGRPTYLHLPRRQFYCSECQKYSTESLEFVDWKRRHTRRYEEDVYQRVQSSNMEQIGREEGLKYDEIKGMFDHISTKKKREIKPTKRISIDEISMRKGQQDFVTVVSDIERSCLIEVIDSHKQDEIIATLLELPLELREAVEEVSVDMWGGFPKVIAEVFPNAMIVFDRFHVMQSVNRELNKLRWKLNVRDRGSKYLLLRNQEDLTDKQKVELESIFSRCECLRVAYEIKEDLRAIYEDSRTIKSGKKRLKKWLRTAGIIFVESSQTIQNHLDGICNYFKSRTTSGVMEGINNRIKLIMRQGYGFSNFNNFRSRILACLND